MDFLILLVIEPSQILPFIERFGLPIVILFGVVYYFFKREKKREEVIEKKDNVIMQLNSEKVEILQKALAQYKENDEKNIQLLSDISVTLSGLKNQLDKR